MIRFENVVKSFSKKVILNHLDLEIPKGKITFIVGKSGEGKSVTLKHILGLMKPDSGRVFVGGEDITELSGENLRKHRQRFGMLFQMAALFDSLNVYDNVAFPLKESGHNDEKENLQKIKEVLSMVGLPDILNKFPSELSIGEKKRVGLARALVNNPDIILYDEPTTGFDPLIAEMIDHLIVKVGRERPDLTSIVVSHDLKATLECAQHIIMLYQGKVVLSGTSKEFRNTENKIVRQFFSGKQEGPMVFL
jgi:phospholipid/cholesterol/gamma-HCH transport system ATP-binding protein